MIDPADFFHTGIAVPDLAATAAELSASLGIRWTPVRSVPFDVRVGDDVMPLEFRAIYSVSGPPHTELVQAIPGTFWAADDRPRVHHLGYWAHDLPARVRELQEQGGILEAYDTGAAGDMRVFAFVRCAGLTIELISSTRREGLAQMIASAAG
jgi:glyoxalase/bleomycin resistance protein/dioxygenase superfamily protein